MRVNDRLFDNEVLAASYRWPFLTGPYVQSAVNIDIRRVITGDEFGHLVIDGLRVEDARAGYQGLSPEEVDAVLDGWTLHSGPTGSHPPTRIWQRRSRSGHWGSSVPRRSSPSKYALLNRTIESAAWPAATAALFAQVSAHGGR